MCLLGKLCVHTRWMKCKGRAHSDVIVYNMKPNKERKKKDHLDIVNYSFFFLVVNSKSETKKQHTRSHSHCILLLTVSPFRY